MTKRGRPRHPDILTPREWEVLTLLREGTGLYELLTFPFPYPKDYASPYEQMELTDYAWD